MKEQFTTYKGVQIWTFESRDEIGVHTTYFGSTLGASDARLFVTAQGCSHADCANKVKRAFDETQKEILEKK